MNLEKIMNDRQTVFRLDHVSKVFSDGKNETKALDDINLEIKKGDIFGIIGMSGAGKSTLVRTLNRLEDVTDGTVYFNGRDLTALTPSELRRIRQSIGMIFQNFNLLMQKTVLKNVMMALKVAGAPKSEQISKARKMLEIVGLADKEDAYPAQLSGGQKQRVAIARAMSTDPEVLLCDEATSALDPKITNEILDLLQKINREMGVTIIIITHEMKVVEKICTKVAVINHGRLEETGSVQDIFTKPSSETGRQLVYPEADQINPFDYTGKRLIRIAFDGHSASEPILANVIQKTGYSINILEANTSSINGQAFGQMIAELPGPEDADEKIIASLREDGVSIAGVQAEGVQQ